MVDTRQSRFVRATVTETVQVTPDGELSLGEWMADSLARASTGQITFEKVNVEEEFVPNRIL